jgi:SAM-dependent methyltransferase
LTGRRTARGAGGGALFLVSGLAAGGCVRLLPGQDVRYSPTPHHVVDAMLRLADVGAHDVVYDLGSGDGRIVIAAARDYGARAVGIEIVPELLTLGEGAAARAGVGERVRFVRQDIFQTDLSQATVVTLYLSEEVNARLRPKLLRELRPGARVVSYRVDMEDWRPDRQIQIDVNGDARTVYLWVVPASR